MPHFTYKYNGIKYKSTLEHFLKDGHDHYRVTAPDGVEFVMAPADSLTANGQIVWDQSNIMGEIIQPHDLVQAIGEGIDNNFKKPNLKKLFKASLFISLLVIGALWLVSNNILLPINGKCHEAVIIDKTIMHGIRLHTYTLAYEFSIDGKKYTGDSGEDQKFRFRIGHNICIVYLNYYPKTSEPVGYFFRGEIKCDCNN